MPSSAEWVVFLGTATVFAICPGPAILYVLARSLQGGRGDGIRSALGNSIGTSVHVVAAAVGLSALLATSPVAFTIVKYAGAAYLGFLGVQAMRHRRVRNGQGTPGPRHARRFARSALVQGVTIELLNPKTALYFMALLPHFVHPERAPAPLVFAVLGLVAVAMALVADVLVAVCAGQLRSRWLGSSRWQERQRTASGLLMIGLGSFVVLA